jgi:hypothetical protein
MPNLNLDLDYFEHPKIRRLVGLLGRGAEVLPIRLWCYCGKYHTSDGALKGYTVQEVESVAGWNGAQGAMIDAFLSVGLMEQKKGVYVIHDWAATNGHLINFKHRATLAAQTRWGTSNATSNAKRKAKQCPNQPYQPTIPTVPIPEMLALLPGFSVAWETWEAARREMKKPLTDTARRQQFAFLEEQPDPVAVVNQSVQNQWRGLFEFKGGASGANNGTGYRGRERQTITADDLRRSLVPPGRTTP